MALKQQFKNLEELLASSKKVVLVDFYAEWCGPCQMMAKILEDVNTQLKGQLRIVKVSTENYPELAARYEVYALPTLVLFQQGQLVKRLEGLRSAAELIRDVRPFL
jgi:thioredoxin